MNTKQIKEFFNHKYNVEECPLTNRLIQAGYQQETGGYITTAYEQNYEVDYKKAEPNQWWHLIKSYCDNTEDDVKFTKKIQCGELIFWMAEISGSVGKGDLEKILNNIIKSGTPIKRRNKNKPNVKYDRRKWNKEIQNLCFDKIIQKVETSINGVH